MCGRTPDNTRCLCLFVTLAIFPAVALDLTLSNVSVRTDRVVSLRDFYEDGSTEYFSKSIMRYKTRSANFISTCFETSPLWEAWKAPLVPPTRTSNSFKNHGDAGLLAE